MLPLYQKIYKKYEDLNTKPLEEPKAEDLEQVKEEFIKAKNFAARMRRHCLSVANIISELNQFGYYMFRQELPLEKAEELCQLISYGGQNKLKPIPCQFKNNDYMTKLSPGDDNPTSVSKMKITVI